MFVFDFAQEVYLAIPPRRRRHYWQLQVFAAGGPQVPKWFAVEY